METLLTVLIASVLTCLPMLEREGGGAKADAVSPVIAEFSAVEPRLVGVGGVAPPGLPSARPDIFLLIPPPPFAEFDEEEEERPPPLRLVPPGVTKPLLVVGVPSALPEKDEEDVEGGIPSAPSPLPLAEFLPPAAPAAPAAAAEGVLGPRIGAAKLKALPGLLGVVTDPCEALLSLSCCEAEDAAAVVPFSAAPENFLWKVMGEVLRPLMLPPPLAPAAPEEGPEAVRPNARFSGLRPMLLPPPPTAAPALPKLLAPMPMPP